MTVAEPHSWYYQEMLSVSAPEEMILSYLNTQIVAL